MIYRTHILFFIFCLVKESLQVKSRTFPKIETKIFQDGDIILGGLFPVHKYNSSARGFCGGIREQASIQRVEAMIYAIDQINRDKTILPGVKLGFKILDYCTSDVVALNQAVKFLPTRPFANELSKKPQQQTCQSEDTTACVPAVIGGYSSLVSMQVASLLRLFRIPQVSYGSTSALLSDKNRFPYFFRTVPPDQHQTKAMISLLTKYNVTYIQTISTKGSYGTEGIKVLLKEAEKLGICSAQQIELSPEITDPKVYDKVVQKLLSHSRAKVVVLFALIDNALNVLRAAKRRKAEGMFTWIGSDGWGGNVDEVLGLEEVALGSMNFKPYGTAIPGFESHFRKVCLREDTRNTWFTELVESKLQCSLRNSTLEFYQRKCKTENIVGFSLTDFRQEDTVPFVIDAVYTVARGLHDMFVKLCPKNKNFKFCTNLSYDGKELSKFISQVSFYGTSGSLIRFDKRHDVFGVYEISRLQRKRKGKGGYKYATVGKWEHGELSLSKDDPDLVPDTKCSDPCGEGERHVQLVEECCWYCQECKKHEILVNNTCIPCSLGFTPDVKAGRCIKNDVRYLSRKDAHVIAVIVLSGLGFLVTLVCAAFYIYHKNNPLIKASSRQFTGIMFVGIAFSFLIAPTFVLKPRTLTCYLQQIGPGISFTLCYAPLALKTNRIYLLFKFSFRRRLQIVKPVSQIAVNIALIGCQAALELFSTMQDPPKVAVGYPPNSNPILQCIHSRFRPLISYIFNAALVAFSTFYAFKTRHLPENFNETKCILGAMYVTCISWAILIPLAFALESPNLMSNFLLCCAVLLSAFAALGGLLLPKVIYVLQERSFLRRQGSGKDSFYLKKTVYVMQPRLLRDDTFRTTMDNEESNKNNPTNSSEAEGETSKPGSTSASPAKSPAGKKKISWKDKFNKTSKTT